MTSDFDLFTLSLEYRVTRRALIGKLKLSFNCVTVYTAISRFEVEFEFD